MARSMTSMQVNAKINGNFKYDGDLDQDTRLPIAFELLQSLTDGDGDSEANQVYFQEGQLAASGRDSIDLYGALENAFGETINAAQIKAIVLINRSDDSDYLETPTDAVIALGGGSDGAGTAAIADLFAAAADQLLLPDGAFGLLCAPNTGWTVTATTADILAVENKDGVDAAYYQILVLLTQ